MDNSPFAKLPAELRNLVYSHALKKDKPYVFGPIRLQGPTPAEHERGAAENPLSLAQTCKAINTECAPLFYSENEFAFSGFDRDSLVAFRKFKASIGDRNAAALQSIGIDMGIVSTNGRWVRMRRDALETIVAGYTANAAMMPHCTVFVKACFHSRGDGRGPSWIHVSLDISAQGLLWSRVFEDLGKTIRTHGDPGVVVLAGEFVSQLQVWRTLLPVSYG